MLDLFNGLARQIHGAQGQPLPLDEALTQHYDDRLQAAITLGYEAHDVSQAEFLRGNVQLFSAAKTAHATQALTNLLLDDNGAVKPWHQFKEEALALHQQYNVSWLRAEYEHAVASAQMAARWHEFEAGDLLEYQTVGDDRVRPEHAAWDGITRPADDAWWQTHYPPNGWLCRCLAVVAAAGARMTPRSILPALPDPDPLFAGNVGQTGIIFPAEHPYFKELSAEAAEQVRKVEQPSGGITPLLEVSKSLKGVRREGVDAALEAIKGVHTLPESPTPNKVLPISFGKLPGDTAGRFSFMRLQDVPPPALRLSSALTDAGEIGFTMLHELGHWIDYTYLDLPRDITRAKAHAKAHADIAGVLDAVEGTELWKRYETLLGNPLTTKARREFLSAYLMQPYEVWARVYSQYIAVQSGNIELAAAVERARGLRIAEQWSNEDFAPVRNAMDALFVKKQWTLKP